MKWILAVMLLAMPYPALAACANYNFDKLQHALELAQQSNLPVAIQTAQKQIEIAEKECSDDEEEDKKEGAHRLNKGDDAFKPNMMGSSEALPQPDCSSKLTNNTISRHCN